MRAEKLRHRPRLLWRGIINAIRGHDIERCLKITTEQRDIWAWHASESENRLRAALPATDSAGVQLAMIAQVPQVKEWLQTGDGSILNAVRCAVQTR